MATEQPKQPDQVPYPLPPHYQHYNGGTFPPPPPPGLPPGVYPPPAMFYPPPGVEGENGVPQSGLIMLHAPPGVGGFVYAYPPGQPFPVPQQAPSQSMLRPKRKQVKMACTNCAQACKRCDETRPCERCVKYGLAETCVDGQRKERRKGMKRGPYKRKSKQVDQPFPDHPDYGQGHPPPPVDPNAPNQQPPPPTDPNGHSMPPEAGGPPFYPMYYPPPGHFVAVGGEGQEGGQPVMSYIFPPYGYPPPFVPGPGPPSNQPPPQDNGKPTEEGQDVGVNPGVVIATGEGGDILSRKRGSSVGAEGAEGSAKRARTEGESQLSDREELM